MFHCLLAKNSSISTISISRLTLQGAETAKMFSTATAIVVEWYAVYQSVHNSIRIQDTEPTRLPSTTGWQITRSSAVAEKTRDAPSHIGTVRQHVKINQS